MHSFLCIVVQTCSFYLIPRPTALDTTWENIAEITKYYALTLCDGRKNTGVSQYGAGSSPTADSGNLVPTIWVQGHQRPAIVTLSEGVRSSEMLTRSELMARQKVEDVKKIRKKAINSSEGILNHGQICSDFLPMPMVIVL